jgi:release factor glutamine methyltransferase
MKAKSLKSKAVEKLKGIYDDQEASNIISLLMEVRIGKGALRSDRLLDVHEINLLEHDIARLATSEPIHYVLERAWFHDLQLKVNPSVLIPRPETEELVMWILEDNAGKAAQILDLGTGSGAIAIMLAHRLPQSVIWASDISESALDIIVSNPPYIPAQEAAMMHANVLQWEPHNALFVPDEDPLVFYKAILEISPSLLKPHGILYFEIHEQMDTKLFDLVDTRVWKQPDFRRDLQGKKRMMRVQIR